MKKLLALLALLVATSSFATTASAAKFMPFKIASGGGCGNISPSLSLARNSGVQPLYVFANASATTDSGVTTKPFHELDYSINYGDSSSTFSTGSRSGVNDRNISYGPVGGHVYETAGSYTITLTVKDTAGSTCTTTAGVTVTSADTVFASTATKCVSTSGDFTGCPSGATQTTSSDFDASTLTSTTTRTLFRRGETFNASTNVIITATGPGLLGAYGSGALPIINMSGSVGDQPTVRFGNSSTVNQKDWRVMDLSFVGNSNAEAIGWGGGFDQVTILRVKARSCSDACIFANSAVLNVGSNPHLFDQIAVHDSDLAEPESWALFFNATNFSIQGNTLNSATGSHTLRISIAINGIVANNTMGPNGVGSAGNHVLKLHAPPYGSATDGVAINTRTQKIVVAHNTLTPGNNSTNNWTMAIDPQDNAEDERIADVIVDGNAFTAGTNTCFAIELQGVDVTIRNNVANATGAVCGCFLEVDRRSSAAPAPNGVAVYNNSMYTNSNNLNASDTPFIQIGSSAATAGVTAKNNLGYAPGVSGTPNMFRDQGSGNTKSNNSSDAQTKTNPNLTSVPPTAIGDYKPTSGYSLGAGASVPNLYDATRTLWGGTFDIGAVKH